MKVEGLIPAGAGFQFLGELECKYLIRDQVVHIWFIAQLRLSLSIYNVLENTYARGHTDHQRIEYLSIKENHTHLENNELIMLGWREWVSMPDLGIGPVKAKVDTGARTSALHAYFVEPYHQLDEHRVRFGIHPHPGDNDTDVICDAAVLEERMVTDSGGHAERRFVIASTVVIGKLSHKIEITLTNRDTMKFRMLLGRTALNGCYCVNPRASYLSGNPNVTL
jgi:hypothetical protein